MTSCTRSGFITLNAIGTLLVLGTTIWGIAIVNQYIVLTQGLASNIAAYEADTTARINQRIAAEAALLLQVESNDADLLVSLLGVNDTLTAQIAYLSSVLNVTSGSATTFIETVQALVHAGLADRIQTVNSVPGSNDTLDNIDIVSLSASNLVVVPDAGTNSVGLLLSGLVTDVDAGNAGINVTRVGNVATVSNAGVLSTQGCTGAVTYVASGALAIWADTETSTVTFDSTAIETLITNTQTQLDTLNATVSGLTTSSDGTVTSVDTGVGLTGGPITTNGTLHLADTAVTPGAYTNADVTVDQQGRITSIANGASAGGVTSVGSGTGLTGGPITTSGTLALADTAVTPGTYTAADITVDQQGRITSASSGSIYYPMIRSANTDRLLGWKATTFTPFDLPAATGSSTTTADRTYFAAVEFAVETTLNGTGVLVTALGTPANYALYMALYDQNQTRLGITDDISLTISSTGMIKAPFVDGPITVPAGIYWIAYEATGTFADFPQLLKKTSASYFLDPVGLADTGSLLYQSMWAINNVAGLVPQWGFMLYKIEHMYLFAVY